MTSPPTDERFGIDPSITPIMEDYLKSIYTLHTESGMRVSTSEVATRLDVQPPTVTSMFETLQKRGLIEREKHRPVVLTEDGEVVALRVLRNHRLIESLLVEQFGYSWDEVHDEADRLEHHLSERLANAIAEALDDPGADPHGDPIPDAELNLPADTDAVLLSEVRAGDTVEVTRIRTRENEQFGYLASVGIRPDAEIEVVERAPFGMVTVRSNSHEQSLPEEIAAQILVVPTITTPSENSHSESS